jgi:hypothetical protein
MKACFKLIVGSALCALLFVGCSRKKVDTSELEKAFQATSAQMKAGTGGESGAPESEVKQSLDQALASIKNDDYAGAVVPLQVLRSRPTLTAEQLTAVQDTMAAVQKRLVDRMGQGDAAAERQMEEIRQMRHAIRQNR